MTFHDLPSQVSVPRMPLRAPPRPPHDRAPGGRGGSAAAAARLTTLEQAGDAAASKQGLGRPSSAPHLGTRRALGLDASPFLKAKGSPGRFPPQRLALLGVNANVGELGVLLAVPPKKHRAPPPVPVPTTPNVVRDGAYTRH